MASGRIHPGSRQWVDAMRRLSGTTDATVDMSMGRKVSRDATIPHGVGTAAFDQRLRGGGGDVPPAEQVEAMLQGTTGFALDPFDPAVTFADVLGTIPVSDLGEHVARVNLKWGNLPGNFQHANPVNQPIASDGGLQFAGNQALVADAIARQFFGGGHAALFFCQAVSLAADQVGAGYIIAAGPAAGAVPRFKVGSTAGRGFAFEYRRTDLGDGLGTVALPDGSLPPDVRAIISCEVDFLGGGARMWLNGVRIGNSPIPLAGDPVEDTTSNRSRLGALSAGGAAEFWRGEIGRFVAAPFIPTAQQRAAIEAWVAEGGRAFAAGV